MTSHCFKIVSVFLAAFVLGLLVVQSVCAQNAVPSVTQAEGLSSLDPCFRRECGMFYGRKCGECPSGSFCNPMGRCTPIQITPGKRCVRAGCSGELCVDETREPRMGNCLFQEEYACYSDAVCEVQPNGECGFTASSTLNACLATVGKKPDLVVTNAVISLANNTTCSEFNTLVEIKNQGTANAPSFTMKERVNNSLVIVPPLTVNATYTAVVQGYRQGGESTVIILDLYNEIDEMDESNNTFAGRLKMPALSPQCSPSVVPSVTPSNGRPACPNGAKNSLGDADGDCIINANDFEMWRMVVRTEVSHQRVDPDFDENNKVDIFDYLIWLDSYNSGMYSQ